MAQKLVWRFSLCLAVLTMSGCDGPQSILDQFNRRFHKEWSQFLRGIMGRRGIPLQEINPQDLPIEKQIAANSELLGEMFESVFLQRPKNQKEFVNYVDSIIQGASLEGIYNGFVYSQNYRILEKTGQKVKPEALKFFVEEIYAFEKELPAFSHFTRKSALPIAPPISPSELAQSAGDQGLMADPSANEVIEISLESLSALFKESSFYTLKRILGDEGVLVVNSKKVSKEKLALWYSIWAVKMAEQGVDFGVAQRSSKDRDFHYEWALRASEDRLKWEVVNRLQRVMNHLQGKSK